MCIISQDNDRVHIFLGVPDGCQEEQEPIVGKRNKAEVYEGQERDKFLALTKMEIIRHSFDRPIQSSRDYISSFSAEIE